MTDRFRWNLVFVGLWLMFVAHVLLHLSLSVADMVLGDVAAGRLDEYLVVVVAGWLTFVALEMTGLALTFAIPKDAGTRLATWIGLLVVALQLVFFAIPLFTRDEGELWLAVVIASLLTILGTVAQYALVHWLAEAIQCGRADDLARVLRYLLFIAFVSPVAVCLFGWLIASIAMSLYNLAYGWCLFELTKCVRAKARGRSAGW